VSASRRIVRFNAGKMFGPPARRIEAKNAALLADKPCAIACRLDEGSLLRKIPFLRPARAGTGSQNLAAEDVDPKGGVVRSRPYRAFAQAGAIVADALDIRRQNAHRLTARAAARRGPRVRQPSSGP